MLRFDEFVWTNGFFIHLLFFLLVMSLFGIFRMTRRKCEDNPESTFTPLPKDITPQVLNLTQIQESIYLTLQMIKNSSAILIVLIAGLFWSFGPLVVRYIDDAHLIPWQYLFFRGSVIFLVLNIYLFLAEGLKFSKNYNKIGFVWVNWR